HSPGRATVYGTGESGIGDAVRDFATVAYAASDGTELWASRYDGPDARSDSATALVVGPECSRIYVTGISEDSAGRSQFATVAYDTLTGTELWSARYGTDSGGDYSWDIDVSGDGSTVFVTGGGGASAQDFITVSYDAATGTELWVSRYEGFGGDDSAFSVGVAPDDSTVYVTGPSQGPTTGYDFATVAYEAATGTGLRA